MATELEVKYALRDPAQLEKILRELQVQWQPITMESIYYDTADGALSARKWTLRLRRENGETVVCMKTPGTVVDGAYRRGEWELCCGSPEAAIDQLVALGAPAELQTLTAGQPLQILCGAEFVRRAALVTLPEATLELAADSGVLTGGGRSVPLCELEVEHKSGDPEATLAYAAALAERFGLQPEPKSKFQRALALTHG